MASFIVFLSPKSILLCYFSIYISELIKYTLSRYNFQCPCTKSFAFFVISINQGSTFSRTKSILDSAPCSFALSLIHFTFPVALFFESITDVTVCSSVQISVLTLFGLGRGGGRAKWPPEGFC